MPLEKCAASQAGFLAFTPVDQTGARRLLRSYAIALLVVPVDVALQGTAEFVTWRSRQQKFQPGLQSPRPPWLWTPLVTPWPD